MQNEDEKSTLRCPKCNHKFWFYQRGEFRCAKCGEILPFNNNINKK